MAVCEMCVLPSPFASHVNKFSSHQSRLPVRWARVRLRINRSAPKTLSTKKYKFEDVKVYQNNSDGIMCYRNKDGEIICEGYDQGPHFHPDSGQKQEEQFRKDAKLYSIIPGIRLYLVEGVDYACISLLGASFEGKDED